MAASEPGETPTRALARFEIELEFVQLFSSPRYCAFLVAEGWFEDAAFIAYLRYLRSYWARPEYARFLLWPQCLPAIDDLLDDPGLRAALADPQFVAQAEADADTTWRAGKR